MWSVADGAKGRRWRSATTQADGRLASTLLLETAPDGRLSRLELATGEGILTLHPDGSPVRLHGNVVRQAGIDHIALPWSDVHALFVGDSPLTAAAAVAGLAARIGVGEERVVEAVEVGADLRPRTTTWRVNRTGERGWRLQAAGGAASFEVALDTDGIPTAADGSSWPLEADSR